MKGLFLVLVILSVSQTEAQVPRWVLNRLNGVPTESNDRPANGQNGNGEVSVCQEGQFECSFFGSPLCISNDWLCDGWRDCPDGTDEKDCVCETSEFQCASGGCVTDLGRCDGSADCEDNTDEEGCGMLAECQTNEFRCTFSTAPAVQCVNKLLLCDGRPHCDDGSDELNCTCKGTEFMCTNEGCIELLQRCDGGRDCADGSDEVGCSCDEDQFRCTKYHACIAEKQRCDGNIDCLDGTDEQDCVCDLETQFACESGGCVGKDYVCDGRFKCPDGSDEKNCVCKPDDEYECHSGGCITAGWRCDGIHQCEDGSDEQNCVCRVDQFRCASGGCIAYRFVCDQRLDCQDGSDEAQCKKIINPSQIVELPMECPPEYPKDEWYKWRPNNRNNVVNFRLCNPNCSDSRTVIPAFKQGRGSFKHLGIIAFEFQFNNMRKDLRHNFLVKKLQTVVRGVRAVNIYYVPDSSNPVTITRKVDISFPSVSTRICSSYTLAPIKAIVMFFFPAKEDENVQIAKTKFNYCLHRN